MHSTGTGTSPENSLPFWRLSAVERRVAAVAIPLSLVARWQAFLPGYSIDDFSFLGSEASSPGGGIARGRWLAFVIRYALTELGAAPPRASALSAILLALVLVGVGLVCCRLWGIRERFAESATATCVIALHPYQAEIFTFRTAALFLAIPLALAFGALAACGGSRRAWWLAVAAVVGALSTYQVVLNYMAMALLFSLVFYVARPEGADTAGFRRTFGSTLKLLLTASCAYAVTTLISTRFTTELFSNRAMLLGLNELGSRADAAWALAVRMFFRAEPVLPVATKWLLLATAAVAAASCFASKTTGRESARLALAFVLAAAAGTIGSIGIVLLLHEWWPMPRVLSQTGLFWAGILALGLRFAPRPVRVPVLACVALIVFSFVGINNSIFNDQLRLNMRDIAKANRILGQIESQADFAGIKGLVISGGHWAYPWPIATAQGDMNISALFAAWSKVLLINEVSGYRFAQAPGDIVMKAEAYCRDAPKWPAKESVIRLDSYAVVCQAPER